MRRSVKEAFVKFTEPLEGHTTYMYCDTIGLVTVGRGNLIDPVSMALGLPFVHNGTSAPASRAEINAAWSLIKSRQDLKLKGGGAYKGLTDVVLTDAGVDDLTYAKLDQLDTAMTKRFPDFQSWPADAQLGVFSMCWGMGPGFAFPMFDKACRAKDFDTAAAQCHMTDKGGNAIEKRNTQNVLCFKNAAKAMKNSLNPETLFWPNVAPDMPAADVTPPTTASASAPAATTAPDEHFEPLSPMQPLTPLQPDLMEPQTQESSLAPAQPMQQLIPNWVVDLFLKIINVITNAFNKKK